MVSNAIYLKKDTFVMKVDLTTLKSCPLGSNLFAVESKMTTRTTTMNHLEATNERVVVMLIKHGTCLYPNDSICTIGCIYLLLSMCLKREELTSLRMKAAQEAQ